MKHLGVLFICVTMGAFVDSARILGVFPLGAKSHHKFIASIMTTMAKAGHEVVVYSPFVVQNPPKNYTDVQLKSIKSSDPSKKSLMGIIKMTELPHWKCYDALWPSGEGIYKEFMGDEEIKKMLLSGEKFDLIVAESFTAQEFTLLLSHVFNAPIIGLQAYFTNNVVNSYMGNDMSLSYVPETCTPFSNEMSFGQRLLSVFASLRGLFYHHTYYLYKLENLMRNDFPSMPPLQDFSDKVSLMFVNDHLMVDYAHPRTSNIISVAGIHIDPPKKLPQDIQEFMDGATEGVIFFSLGTYVPDDLRPKEYFDMFINVFKKLKQRVLWKSRNDNITGLPDNVMTMKWAPQTDILAHPNCVLFLSHGGLLSQHEAIHFGVPVIAIPQFYDQHRNAKYYEQQGIGVRVTNSDLSESTMTAAINEVLNNTRYKDNVKRLSKLFKDRPMSPVESVVYWTNYVLRHGGAEHLRPASAQLRWYQRALLDVSFVTLVVILSIISTMYFLTKSILLKARQSYKLAK